MEPLLGRLGLPAVDLDRVIWVTMLAAARLVPLFVIVPFFGGRLVPMPLRIGFSLAFVALAVPVAAAGAPPAELVGPLGTVVLLGKELLVGVILGLLAAVPFWAADAAGRMTDAARGAAAQDVFQPGLGTQTSPLGAVGLQLAILVFFAVDGHLLFLRALAASYEAIPVARLPAGLGSPAMLELAVSATGQLILAALGLAAPMLASLVVADVVLGLVGRVSPQLQLHFIGLPVKAVLGVLVMCLALGGLVTALRGELGASQGLFARALEVLR
jgi:type III secretion protein SpaR/YscT/HrcT